MGLKEKRTRNADGLKEHRKRRGNSSAWRTATVLGPQHDPGVGGHGSWKITVDWVFGHAKSTAGNLIVKMLVPSTFVSLEPRTM